MDDSLLHEKTILELKNAIRNPSHAYVVLGSEGSGRELVASRIAMKLLGSTVDDISFQSNTKCITSDSSIGIESVREIRAFLRLKTVGTAKVRRLVLIDNAHLMTTESQNALLKLLEEPPDDTVFILSADAKYPLLPTILSRVQTIRLLSPSVEMTVGHFAKQGHEDEAIRRTYLIANGQPLLMQALLTEESEHPLAKAVSSAKELAAKSKYDRLLLVDEIAKDKHFRHELLYALKRLFSAGLIQAGKRANTNEVSLYVKRLNLLLAAEKSLKLNGSPKLVLTDLFMQL